MVCGGSDGVWRKGWCVEEGLSSRGNFHFLLTIPLHHPMSTIPCLGAHLCWCWDGKRPCAPVSRGGEVLSGGSRALCGVTGQPEGHALPGNPLYRQAKGLCELCVV